MTQEEKQRYVDVMRAKALAYAESKLSDVKIVISQEDYQGMIEEYANAFLSGANEQLALLKELSAKNRGGF